MRDKCFTLLQEIEYYEYYFFHYRVRSTRIQMMIKAFLAIATSASISSWIIWKDAQAVWAAIIAVSQVILAIEHLFPYTKQITTINFLLPDIRLLSCEIKNSFDTIDTIPENEANTLISNYKRKYLGMVQKYVGDTYFPYSMRCRKKAIQDRDDSLRFQYDINQNQNMEVTQE